MGTLAFKRPFDQIAEEFGVSATTVKRAFGFCTSVLDKMQEDIKTPRVLGIDEVHIDHDMRAVFCDVENGLILDMCEKRSKATISKFLKRLNKSKVRVVTMDMWQPYHNAVSEILPKAVRIVDKFHVIQYGNKALDIVRKEIKDTDAQKRLKKERYLLLKNKESLSDVDIQRLDAWFAAFPRLQQAYALKEGLRDMYTATDKQTALDLFEDWSGSISIDMPAYLDVRNMIERWKEPIFNYFNHPITNAYTESANNLIKHIHKAGRGYSFEVLRAKVLYGTKATRKPKYAEEDFSRISFSVPSFSTNLFDTEPIQGFGVSISTLSRIFENEEF